MLIDTHAHLDDEKIFPDLEGVLARAREVGVQKIITVGCDTPTSKKCVEIAKSHDGIFAAVGCHPHEAESFSSADERLYRELAKDDKVVAIGEIGLDYFYDLSPRERQKEVFAAQLDLAYELGLPAVLHVRDAYKDAFDVLNAKKSALPKILLHCYSGSEEMAREFMRFDAYFAFGGAITFKNAKKEGVLAAVKERLMFETDCPYMTPVPFRGTTNEPCRVQLAYQKAAELLGTSVAVLEKRAEENVRTLFGV